MAKVLAYIEAADKIVNTADKAVKVIDKSADAFEKHVNVVNKAIPVVEKGANMISILTQSKAIINIDKITTISAAIDETHDNKIAVVADQSYVLGYYYVPFVLVDIHKF